MWLHTDACLHSWNATNADNPKSETHCVLQPTLPYPEYAHSGQGATLQNLCQKGEEQVVFEKASCNASRSTVEEMIKKNV